MVIPEILHRRMERQRLSQNPLETPQEVVSWLGAVQAQDYLGSKWALGLRIQDATDDRIERAFTDGHILRTHVMRPTWHFVAPADLRWLLALTAPRVNRGNTYLYRRLELDEALFRRTNALISDALRGGRTLTRAELGAVLSEAGIPAEGQRLAYILMRAELDAVLCSGPRRGKQFTYALLEERAPEAPTLGRDEALAELTRRYYTGHGPATVQDFSWWSGLTLADVKMGLDMVGSELDWEAINGQTYYFSPSTPEAASRSEAAFLLPAYDELLVGYASFGKSRTGGQDDRKIPFDARVLIGDQIKGGWRRTFKKGEVVVEIAPFARLTAVEEAVVAAAVRRYGDFAGMPARHTILV